MAAEAQWPPPSPHNHCDNITQVNADAEEITQISRAGFYTTTTEDIQNMQA